MYRSFKFIRPYKSVEGTIEPGNEIRVLNGTIYYNGGMLHPGFYEEFRTLIEKEMIKPHYLKEVPIPYNKV